MTPVKPDKVKFLYKYAPDYNPVYVNGAEGGFSPKGEFMLHFYLERQALLKSYTMSNKDEDWGAEIRNERDPIDTQFVRYVETGIVINIEFAQRLHELLGEALKKYAPDSNPE
jgi:hypothetical protein